MLSRRQLLAAGAALAAGSAGLRSAEAHKAGEKYVLPEKFMPRLVSMRQRFEPGTIDVFPDQYWLFLHLSGRKALRYSVGVGRGNLYHSGAFFVGAKKEWPEWTPTPDMIRRDPDQYAKHADGMAGGINNPLGARALYLFTKEKGDTFLRIHGTNDPRTIGVAVSNGCARLVNDQVVELYDKVPEGTRVVLHPKSGMGPVHS
uniref:L,D-transpeptidase n=1 Tax=Pararhizobium sp. IMCC3301 TaxID=3067904 RepID=UPI002740AEA9|nr:L,D-transpeptidase [Pararhizobium sp. IMCC3301]